LTEQITQKSQHLQSESAAAASLREQHATLLRHGQFLEQQRTELQQQSHTLRRDIGQLQQLQISEQEYMELVHKQRQYEVPRLQQQISLYAACTGVKWDFVAQENSSNGNLIAGNVVRIFYVLL